MNEFRLALSLKYQPSESTREMKKASKFKSPISSPPLADKVCRSTEKSRWNSLPREVTWLLSCLLISYVSRTIVCLQQQIALSILHSHLHRFKTVKTENLCLPVNDNATVFMILVALDWFR